MAFPSLGPPASSIRWAHEADDVALEGQLAIVSLFEVLQLVGIGGHSAAIELAANDEYAGRVELRAGVVTGCWSADREGIAAFFELARVQRGRFRVLVRPLTGEPTMDVHWQELVLEAARQHDEAQRQADERPPERSSELWLGEAPAANAPALALWPAEERPTSPAQRALGDEGALPRGVGRPVAEVRIEAAESDFARLKHEATLAYVRGDYAEALRLFERCRELAPLDRMVMHNLQKLRARAGGPG